MDGPERLEDDARPARRRTLALVAVAVLVVAGLGALRLPALLPDPTDASSSGSSTGSSTESSTGSSAHVLATAWPHGTGNGTLYVLDAGAVVTIDAGSGLVQRSRLSIDTGSAVMTAAGYGVLVRFADGAGTPRLVWPGSTAPPMASGILGRSQQFFPGPGTAVWASSADAGATDDRSTWRLVDVDDLVAATVRLAGYVQADGSGGLFASRDARVRHVLAGKPETGWRGEVGAAGPDGYEVVRCTGRRCAAVLHDRVSGSEAPLAARASTANDGGTVLSPRNRLAASVHAVADDDEHPVVVRVGVPGAVRELRSFPASEDATSSLSWLSDRWLAATSDTGLVLYDAVDDRLVTPDLGLVRPTQLVFRPA